MITSRAPPRECQPGNQSPLLGVGACRIPAPVAEHEHIRPGQAAAFRAAWQGRNRAHCLVIDRQRAVIGREDPRAAVIKALQRAQRAVNLIDTLGRKAVRWKWPSTLDV